MDPVSSAEATVERGFIISVISCWIVLIVSIALHGMVCCVGDI